tara:strand:- start:73 stop:309 length:237 start_codon:yes stop_codon:yes gene_type:complete
MSEQRTQHNSLERIRYRMLSYNLVGMIPENKPFGMKNHFDSQNNLEKKVFGWLTHLQEHNDPRRLIYMKTELSNHCWD